MLIFNYFFVMLMFNYFCFFIIDKFPIIYAFICYEAKVWFKLKSLLTLQVLIYLLSLQSVKMPNKENFLILQIHFVKSFISWFIMFRIIFILVINFYYYLYYLIEVFTNQEQISKQGEISILYVKISTEFKKFMGGLHAGLIWPLSQLNR